MVAVKVSIVVVFAIMLWSQEDRSGKSFESGKDKGGGLGSQPSSGTDSQRDLSLSFMSSSTKGH